MIRQQNKKYKCHENALNAWNTEKENASLSLNHSIKTV